MAAVTAVPAFAAMDATLSSDHARPGDKLLLLTADHNGTWNYESLASENQQSIYLASVTASPRKHAVDRAVQSLDASSGEATQEASGSLYPAFPLAEYWVFMETFGQCWRIAEPKGRTNDVIVLTIGSTPADNQEAAAAWTLDSLPRPSPPALPKPHIQAAAGASVGIWWLWIVGACALLLVLLTASRRALRSTKTPTR